MPVFLFPVRVMFLFTFSALFFTLLFPLIPWASSLFVLITVPGLCVCFSVQASPPSHFFFFFPCRPLICAAPVLPTLHSHTSPANSKFRVVILFRSRACNIYAQEKKKKKTCARQICSNEVSQICASPTEHTGASSWHSAREQRHNRPETIEHREKTGPPVRDIYIIEKDFERAAEAACPENTHTHTHTHTHSLPASLSDMPNNDLSSVSVSLSPLQVACCCCLPLCHVSLLPPSTRCALQYHSNHNLILTKRIPTQQRDVSLRITN